jgi:hypothetical protein
VTTRRAPKQSEAAIQRAILHVLTAKGYWAWRVNSGATVVGEGAGRRMFRGAPPGTPDIRVEAPVQGYLEVKAPGGRMSPSQLTWHEKAEKWSVNAAVVHSASEAIAAVQRWGRLRDQ